MVIDASARSRSEVDVMNDAEWQPMSTAPKNATDVRVRMADGKVIDRAHWACDLSGEDQPPFRGWFCPVLRADGSVSYYAGLGEPVGWMPVREHARKVTP